MAARATRCPHCQTSFRVTEAQLATARGLVRCGACLEVFDARENWVEPSPSEEESALKPEPTSAEVDSPNAATGRDAAPNTGSTDTAKNWDDETDEPDFSDSSPAEASPEHVDPEEAQPAESGFSTRDESDESESYGASFTANDVDDDDFIDDATLSVEEPALKTDNDRDEDAFEQLVHQRRQQIRIDRYQVMWSTLSLLALLALAAQLVHANFNELAQSSYREKLAETCRVVNWLGQCEYCILPPPQNLKRIESRGLNVMSHPQYSNSLLVDALIINTAAFSQPFPAVQLAFTNERGAVVAQRRFQPTEYLHGELAGIAMMPVGQSVRIQISILDPGTTAINYQMQFSPAQAAM